MSIFCLSSPSLQKLRRLHAPVSLACVIVLPQWSESSLSLSPITRRDIILVIVMLSLAAVSPLTVDMMLAVVVTFCFK